MLIEQRVPKTMQWLVKLLFIYLFIFTLFRLATVFFFKPDDISFLSLAPSFWLGLKYDLRWIAIILLPIALVSLFKKLNPFYSLRTKNIWTVYLAITTLLVLFFYGADFAQFSTAHARLNANDVIPIKEYRNRLNYIWKNYPVIWISLGFVGALLMVLWMMKKQHGDVTDKNLHVHKFSYRRRWYACGLVLLVWFIYGLFTTKPLRLDRAFEFNNSFKANLALNPLQNYFTTRRIKREKEELELQKQKP